MGNSLCGICFGLVLIPLTVALLSWNENESRAQYLLLEEGRKLVEDAPNQKTLASPSVLYHISGPLETTCVLKDADLGIEVNGALLLERNAELYQVKEHKHTSTTKTAGGGETTTTSYSYSEEWASSLIRSSDFHDRSYASSNPSGWTYGPATYTCHEATVAGSYKIGTALINDLARSALQPVNVADPQISAPARRQLELASSEEQDEDPQPVKGKKGKKSEKKSKAVTKTSKELSSAPVRIHGNSLYLSATEGNRNPAINPRVGDERFSYTAATIHSASFLGAVDPYSGAIKPFKMKSAGGRTLLLSSPGLKDADELLDEAQSSNTLKLWLLRLLGWVLFLVAFNLFFQPLVLAPQLVPWLGDFVSAIIGWGTGIISFVLATALAVVVVAIAWIAVRPVLSGTLLVGAAGLVIYLFTAKRKAAATTSAPKND
jgi:Transmembrane protein 43